MLKTIRMKPDTSDEILAQVRLALSARIISERTVDCAVEFVAQFAEVGELDDFLSSIGWAPVRGKMPKTPREALVLMSQEFGYDGLFNEAGECSCLFDDPAPCEHLNLDGCRFGFLVAQNDEGPVLVPSL